MATSDPFNAVGGISVGIPAIQVIDSNGNVITSNLSVANITGGNMTITGNIMVGGIKTDNYYYSNGVPVAFGGGGGSGSTVQITSITSTAVDFTVTLPTVPVTWAVGNTVTIYNTTPTQYNGDWIIASITGTTVTVSTPINPGPSTVNGIIQSKYSTNYPVPGFDTQLIFNIGGNACASPNLRFDPVVSMLHVDGNICVEGTAIANYFSGDGSNITNVTANLANYVTQGNQSNITRLGTLLELNVAGNANLGNVGNIKIFGGTSSQILINDGSNGLVWGNGPNAISNGSSNVTIATSGGPVTISSGGVSNVVTVNPSNIVVQAVEVWVSGNVRANYFDGNGARLTNLNAANLVGAIPYAAVAGTVASNAQPNITSLGTLNSLTVSGPVNLGSVTDVTITGGAPSQVLSTDGSGGLSWVSVALSNAITDGTSAMQVYPSGDITANVNGVANVLVINEFDITSKANFNPDANNTYDLGNLTNQWRDLYLSGTTLYFDGIPIRYTGGSGGNLSVEGNVVPTYDSTNNDDLTTPANIVATGTITSPAFFGDAGNLSNITGSNITGPVANATHAVNADDALRAGTVTTAAQPNITSVGTLTSLNSSGNITASNLVTSGVVSAVGNITGGNLVTTGGLFAGTLNITGNITGSNLNSTGNIEALGYIEGGNIFANAGTVKGAVGNFSTVVGSLLTNAQPNITSVGTLTSLTVGGNTLSGNVYANSGTVGANTVRANNLVMTGNVQGHFLPSANITYDLGSPTQRWKDIYLSNNTIFLGQAPIRANGNSTIVVPVLEILEGFRGNLVPVANAQYSIGAPDAQWNFVGAASIQIGNTVLEESPTGELLLGNNTVVTSTPNGSIGSNSFTALEFVETDTLIANTANITDLNATGSLDVTGNIIANGHLQVHEDSTFDGNVTIGGNLTINGNISYIDVTDLRISDPVIQQGGGPNGTPLTANDGRDRGQLLHVFDVAANTEVDKFQGWDNSANEFVFVSNAVNVNDVITINEYGNVRAGYFIGNGYALSDITGGNVTGVVANSNYSSFANVAYNVSGGNVSGEVDYAAVANSVDLSNVVGIGNISTINLDGNAYNVLRGDGTWSQDSGSLPIANGNSKLDIATIDGNITITTNGLNTWTFDTDGNTTLANGGLLEFPANTYGPPTTNVRSVGTKIVLWPQVEFDNDVDYAIGVDSRTLWNSIPAVETLVGQFPYYFKWYAAENLLMSLQGNGNLYLNGPLTATGNITGNYVIGNGYALTNISGGNVTGEVSNANFASYSNLANISNVSYSVDLSNVVGIGNISTINLDGNAYNVLRGDGTWSQDNRSLPIANGNSKLDIATIDGNITITSNGLNTWTFDTTGNLTIPGSSGGLIKTVPNASIGVVAVDNGSGNPAQLMLWKVSDLNPDTIISAYPTNATIQTNVNGTINTWEFGHDGVLSLPGSLTAQGNLGSPAPGINGFSSIDTYDGANLGNVLITKVSGQRGNIIAGNISLTGNISALNIGNIASINIDGNGGNILYGNGVFAEFPDISNSNYSNYSGNVVNSSQPNITSLGTLTGLTVDGLSSFGDVGNVSITGGNSGYVLGTDGNGNLSWIDHEPIANSVIASTNDPMGFDEATKLTSTTISFDDITRTFTVSPVDSNYSYWVKGTQYISTVSQSVTIPNVSGTYYISFNDSGNLQASTTPFNFSEVASVAYLYWNSVLSSAQFLFDERHGTSMDHATHEYLHRTRGASMSFVPSVGFVLSATTSGDGSSNSDAQIGISSGTFYDEDIEVNVVVSNTPTPNTWEQDLTNPGKIPVLYRSGSLWVLDSPTDYPIKFGVARPTYNLNTGGTWSTPDVSNNQYFVQWIVATNNLNYPVISIMGQTQFSSLSSAQESNFSDLNLSSLPIAEMRPLYGLVLQTSNGYTNVIKARLRSYSDIRLFTQSIASLDVDGVDIAFRETPETVFASDATSLAAWNSYISNTIGNYSGNITFDISSISITGGNAGDIISTDGSGNLTYVAPYSLSVGNLSASNGNTFINTFSNVTTLGFDEDSGFSVDDLGNGVVKIAINSTFKFWEVNGNTGLIAEGLDTVNFIAGSGITIEANNDSSPKTFTIAATGGGGGNVGGSNTQIQYNDDGSFAGASDFTYDNTLNRVNISNTVSGATGIVLGDPALGSLVSNALTLSNSSSVSNSIAQLNAILGKLVPPSPPAYPASQSLSIGSLSTYRMTNFTQTDNTPGANKSVSGGTTVTNVRRAGTYNANSIVNAGPGDNGTITVYLNGTTAGSRTLTTSLDGNGTYSNLVIYNNYDYNVANSSITPGFWSVVSTRAAGSVSSGWNEVYISHSAAGNTNTPYWYYDSSAPGTPQFSNVSIEPTTNSYTYTSTVPHYNSSSVFTLSFDVNRLSGDTYPTSDTFITGTSGGSFNAPSSVTYSSAGITTPLERNLYVSSGNVSVTTTSGIRTGFGSSSTGPSLSAFNSYATGTQAFAPGVTVLYKTGTSSTMEESNVRIGSTIGSGSGLAYRVINPGSTDTPVYSANATAFNSQTSTLEVYDATIVSAILKHDVTNYSTGYLPVGPDLSVGRSGDQYFTFKFIRTSVSKFDIKWTGTIAGLWVALPGSTIDSTSGLNGWLDLSVAYAGAGVPGSLVGGNGSDGASLGGVAPLNSAQTNKSVTATFGTVSSSSTATNEIYVRIKLTSGQTVTALSLETASN